MKNVLVFGFRQYAQQICNIIFGFVLLFIPLLSLSQAQSAPIITRVLINSGLPETVVEIFGSNFETIPSRNIVKFGESEAGVVSEHKDSLRVVVLRDVETGLISVQSSVSIAVSADKLERNGSTGRATPEQDSGPRLIEGISLDPDRSYDMSPIGLDQKILLVRATPSGIDPENFAPVNITAREPVVHKLDGMGPHMKGATHG